MNKEKTNAEGWFIQNCFSDITRYELMIKAMHDKRYDALLWMANNLYFDLDAKTREKLILNIKNLKNWRNQLDECNIRHIKKEKSY